MPLISFSIIMKPNKQSLEITLGKLLWRPFTNSDAFFLFMCDCQRLICVKLNTLQFSFETQQLFSMNLSRCVVSVFLVSFLLTTASTSKVDACLITLTNNTCPLIIPPMTPIVIRYQKCSQEPLELHSNQMLKRHTASVSLYHNPYSFNSN